MFLSTTCRIASFAAGAMLAISAQAETYHQAAIAGGIQITNFNVDRVTWSGNNATVYFHGLQAPYMVQMTTNAGATFADVAIAKLMAPNYSGSVLVTNANPVSSQFRLMLLGATNWVGKWNYTALDKTNVFVGSATCSGCHGSKADEWAGTKHATAIYRLMDTNGNFTGHAAPFCVPCHSVGNGQPGGFVSLTSTPQLANVGCETCHGSANAHVNISGRQYHPVKALSAEICGGCHTGSHHPTYDEWTNSLHAEVTADVAFGSSGMTNAGTTGYNRQMQCGFCHSGATRMAMIADYEARQRGITNALGLPDGHEAAESPVTCAVCHDPHSDARVAQLRYPTRSTNSHTLYTGYRSAISGVYTNPSGTMGTNVYYMNDGFASQYNPNIQICGQCHNSRGARWDGYSRTWTGTNFVMTPPSTTSGNRPPHHSPQYNMLIGIVQDDYLNGTVNYSSAHAGLSSTSGNTNQCLACHVPSYAVSATTNVTGHSFALDVKGCALAGCHTSYPLDGLHVKVEERQFNASNGIARVVSLLNQWATSKAPVGFTKGANNWEHTTPGILAPSGYNVSGAGPSGAQQTLIPSEIKKARFNLYMVQHDGSMGVHNYSYSDFLIRNADTNVSSLFPLANFRATSTSVYTNVAVVFTNLGSGTSYSWDFGDGGTANVANPSYTYTTPGFKSVTCTVDGEIMMRTNYIRVCTKPVVSFSADNTTVGVGMPVTFTNNSSGISDVGLWRWTFNVPSSSSRLDSGFTPTATYTYTNAGTFTVSLRASVPAGSVSVTNTAFITVTNVP